MMRKTFTADILLVVALVSVVAGYFIGWHTHEAYPTPTIALYVPDAIPVADLQTVLEADGEMQRKPLGMVGGCKYELYALGLCR